jgi:hypothetical protein
MIGSATAANERTVETMPYLPSAVRNNDGEVVSITDRVGLPVALETQHSEAHGLADHLRLLPPPGHLQHTIAADWRQCFNPGSKDH